MVNDENMSLEKRIENLEREVEILKKQLLKKNETCDQNLSDDNLEMTIAKFLNNLGIHGNIRGYRYLIYGIKLCLEDICYLGGITKTLYPTVAKEFETTAPRVERAIRHAVTSTWDRNGTTLWQDIFKFEVKECPTNSMFIAMAAEAIKFNLK